MKIFERKKIAKKLLIAFVIIITISNFIMPNYVQAESIGEKLVSGLCYLLAKIGDVCISTMQKFFIGTSDIKESGNYSIKYSPGLIFSGNLSAFDINFINPEKPESIYISGKLIYYDKGLFSFDSEKYQTVSNVASDFLKEYITKEDFGEEPVETYVQFREGVVPDEVEKYYDFDANEALVVTDTRKSRKFISYSKDYSFGT